MNLILYILLLLIVLASFGQYFNKYNCAITSLLIIFAVVYLMTNELEKSLLISIGLTLLLSLVKCPNQLENFETKKSEESEMLKKINNVDEDEDISNDDEKDIPKYSIHSGNDVEDLIPKSFKITSNTPVEMMTPAQAQRESFKLARSVEHLKNTMDQLGTNLTSAKKVMDMFKAIRP